MKMEVFILQVNKIHTLVSKICLTFFVSKGTSRRGEDGDSSKNRRQPKAVKPKKIGKVDGHFIVHASCNNGTSALVTNTGKLIMLGKDTMHCDTSTGFVAEIHDQHITKVALGKAHTVALNSKGQIFAFGMNNKGQCGRSKGKPSQCAQEVDFGMKSQQSQSSSSVNSAGTQKFDVSNMCDFDEHNIVHGKCRVCSICRECTEYNMSCVSTQKMFFDQRIPGA